MRKRYLFAISLILLFLGTLIMTNNAWSVCTDYRHYECDFTVTDNGVIIATGVECVDLCNDPGNRDIYGFLWGCYLGAISPKEMLGSGNSLLGDIGCSVDLYGKSMTATVYEEYNDHLMHLRCKPCVVCCP